MRIVLASVDDISDIELICERLKLAANVVHEIRERLILAHPVAESV